MIRTEITAVKYPLDKETKKYVRQKIAGLDRFLNPRLRQSAFVKVVLTEKDGEGDNRYICEAILNLPKEQIMAKEGTTNMFGSIDLVEEKLRVQLLKYKGKLLSTRDRTRRTIARLRRGFPLGRRR